MRVLLFDYFDGCFLVKKWIRKGMSKPISKPIRKVNFSKRKCEEINAIDLKRRKIQGIFGETVTWALLSSAVFFLQSRLSDLF